MHERIVTHEKNRAASWPPGFDRIAARDRRFD
jgi:hypothetical protein